MPGSPDSEGQPGTGRPTAWLPDLPDEDIWCDMAGASALAGVAPTTITAWLSRGGPKRMPFPVPVRLLYRLYYPVSSIREWAADQNPAKNSLCSSKYFGPIRTQVYALGGADVPPGRRQAVSAVNANARCRMPWALLPANTLSR